MDATRKMVTDDADTNGAGPSATKPRKHREGAPMRDGRWTSVREADNRDKTRAGTWGPWPDSIGIEMQPLARVELCRFSVTHLAHARQKQEAGRKIYQNTNTNKSRHRRRRLKRVSRKRADEREMCICS